jgi:hypothetical protein
LRTALDIADDVLQPALAFAVQREGRFLTFVNGIPLAVVRRATARDLIDAFIYRVACGTFSSMDQTTQSQQTRLR